MSDLVTGARSPVVCSYCLWRLTEAGGDRTVCTSCGTAYHSDCFEENGGCATFGCEDWLAGQAEQIAEEVGYEVRPSAAAPAPAAEQPVQLAGGGYCTSCGAGMEIGQRFCTSCGEAVQ